MSKTLSDGDVIHRAWSGEETLSHYFVNVGTGRHIVWVCKNCGAPRDE